jgi:hypothetical protein
VKVLDRKDSLIIYVPDLTHLRYYCPLILNIVEKCKKNIVIAFVTTNAKYNGLRIQQNSERFLEIYQKYLAAYDVECICVNDANQVICNIAITVDCSPLYKKLFYCQKHLAIQHGVDHGYDSLGQHRAENTIQILSSDVYASLLQTDSYVSLAYPISCWSTTFDRDINNIIDIEIIKKCALIFYPEIGFHDVIDDIVTAVCDRELIPIFKQRRKNQHVQQPENVIYDTLWYPCEATLIPLNCAITVGVGTTAYTDLAHAGVKFIDLALPDYSKSYPKPKLDNFESMNLYNNHAMCQSLDRLLAQHTTTDREHMQSIAVNQFIGLL